MFGKIILQEGGIAASNVCLQALSPLPFPFLAIFFPRQRACSQASEEVTREPADSAPEITGGGTQADDQERLESAQEEVSYISN